LMNKLHEEQAFEVVRFSNMLEPDLMDLVSDLLMQEEKYKLDNWERKNIFVRDKSQTIPQFVSETILHLRCLLIEQKKTELSFKVKGENAPHVEIMEETNNYNKLKVLLSRKLERVV